MAVYYNLKGTTQPFFQIGKGGTTLYQGASDPTGSYTVANGDYWLDTSGRIRVRLSDAWVPATLNVVTADSPPSTPADGDLWWDSTNLTLMIYYADGTSSQWVNATPGIQGAPGIQGTTGTQGTQGVQGIQGIQSIQGIQGVQGISGSIGTANLTDLADVTITSAATGDLLYKSAGDWVNTAKVRWDNTNSYLTIDATSPSIRMFSTLSTDPADNGYMSYQADSFQLGFRDASVPTVFVMMRLNQDKTVELGPNPSFRTYDTANLNFGESAAVVSGKLGLAASTTNYASLRLWNGTAPSSPYDGDMWTTTTGAFVRINGATHTFAPRYTLVATLANDQATGANTTPVTLTNLVWTYEANSVYFFRWIGNIQSAAATTGAGFHLDVSSAVTEIAMTFYHQLANAGTLSGGSATADDASVGVSSGVPTLNVNVPVSGQGMLRTGANTGTAQLRYRSETTAVTTAKAGLTLIVEKVA